MRGVAMSIVGSGFIVGGAMNASGPEDALGVGLLVLGTIIGAIGIRTAGSS